MKHKRFTAIMLCLFMCLSLIPAAAFAEDGYIEDGEIIEIPDFSGESSEEIPGTVESDFDDMITDDEDESYCDEDFSEEDFAGEESFEEDFAEEDSDVDDGILPDEDEISGEPETEDEENEFEAASGTCGSALRWSLTDSGILTVSGTGAMNDYSTTGSATAPWSGYRDRINTVKINSGVTSIGNAAFYMCSGISSISIADSVTSIGVSAFEHCTGISALTLPAALVTIGKHAFDNCTALRSIDIGSKVTTIADFAFSNCTALESVTLGSSLKTIGPSAFYLSGIISIVIPSGVNSIGTEAFKYCSKLASVTLQGSTATIPASCFSGCTSLKSIVIPDTVTKIESYAFSGCTSLSNVNVGSRVTSIEYQAFYNCKSLATLSLPKSLTYVGSNAFMYCSALKDIYYSGSQSDWSYINILAGNDPLNSSTATKHWNSSAPAAVQLLNYGKCGDSLYWYYFSDGSLNIQGSGAMYTYTGADVPWSVYRDSITSVSISGATNISDFAFIGCTKLKNATIPYGVTSIGKCAFMRCSALNSVEIPNSVSSIGDEAFAQCSALSSLNLGSGLKTLGEGAFTSCTSLTGISLPAPLQEIGMFAFYGCTAIKAFSVSSSSSWFKTADGVLYSANGSKLVAYPPARQASSFTVPEGTVQILEGAFYSCTKLTEIVFPVSVTFIGQEAFNGCDNIKTVKYAGVSAQWAKIDIGDHNDPITKASVIFTGSISGKCGDNLTWNYTNGTLVISGSGRMYDYAYADLPWRSVNAEINSVVLPAGITYIGDNAFRYCTAVKGFTIPASVTEIKYSAFTYCNSVTAFTVDAGNKNFVSVDGVIYTRDKTVLMFYPAANARTSYTVPEGVTALLGRSFINSKNLKTVNLPYSLTTFSNSTFAGCSSLVSITIPAKIKSIGNNVFDSCTGLKVIYFAGNAPAIDGTAFNGVTATAYYPAENSTWTADKFQNYGGSLTWKAHSAATQLPAPVVTSAANYESFIKVVWEPVASAEMYRLSYRKGTADWIKICDTPSTRINVYDVEDGATYTFKVECYSKDGKTRLSPESNRVGQMRLTTPEITVKRFGGPGEPGGFRVDWQPTVGGSQYKIYYREKGGSWNLYTMIPKTANTLFCNIKASITNANPNMTNLAAGKTYEFMVLTCTSVASVTSGFPTSFVSCEFISSVPLVSPAVELVNVASGVAVSWNSCPNATSYKVYYRVYGNSSWILSSTTTGLDTVVSGLTKGVTYEFCVLSCANGQTSSFPSRGATITYMYSGTSKTGYINRDGVNFRAGPGTGYSIICTVNYGTALTFIQDMGNSWYMVIINGTTGYVYSTYVTLYS